MAGIIKDAQDSKSKPPAEEPRDQAAKAGSGDVSPEGVRAKMQVPPDQAQTYDKIVEAGKRILYSEQMGPQVQEALKGPGSMGDKLGRGVAVIMALLMDKTNGSLPPQLIIPAALELVAEAGAFLKDGGVNVSDQDIAEGMAVLVETILSKAGVQLDQIPQLLQGGGEQGAQQPAPPAGAAPPVTPDGKPQMGV